MVDKICGYIFDLSNKQKHNTMTKQQLIAKATEKNFTIEFSKDKFGNEIIGINKNNNCYHWFEILNDDCLLFNHTYSMNTGKSIKGTLHGLRIINSLN